MPIVRTAASRQVSALETGKPIQRSLSPGESHAYSVALESGQFLDATVNQRGIDVLVRVFAPDGTKIAQIDSPNGRAGDEPIGLEAKAAGMYRLEVAAGEPGAPEGRYEIRVNAILSASQYAQRLAKLQQKRSTVIASLKKHAIPLKSVEAGTGFSDLQPLKRILQNVQFVGLGEETHGTREFFLFKHRMVEFLVTELGFRVFAIEASYAACQNINDYVQGAIDDGEQALNSQGFWTWNTHEVRAMLDWMRAYNKRVPADRKIKFAGFDIQNSQRGREKILAFLRRAAPERLKETEELFNISVEALVAARETEKLKALQIQYNTLFVFLELSELRLTKKSATSEYRQICEYARVLVQYIDAYLPGDLQSAVRRDLYMADNFRRLVAQERPGTKMVIWAHNGHIAKEDDPGNFPPFGSYLQALYGASYYAIGFSFNQGGFQSRELTPRVPGRRMLTAFTLGPAPAETVDGYLAQIGLRQLVVDLRSARGAELREWLTKPRLMRSIGSMYDPAVDQQSLTSVTLDKAFDGLFFIDTTARSRPNPGVKDVAPVS